MKIDEEVLKSKRFEVFLEGEDNNKIYLKYLSEKNEENANELNETYKNFERKLIVSSYLRKAIQYEAKRFDKKIRSKEKLIISMDKVVHEDGSTISELLVDEKSSFTYEEIMNKDLNQIFMDEKLNRVVMDLTLKQRKVLYMIYFLELSEKEIGKEMKVTQQSISKIHRAAIKKLRESIN
ncbi:sigma factor-like helix-turn-helix DNA-binding protein [Solibacillus silvestris]